MELEVKQADKAHDTNQLHDEFIAEGLAPLEASADPAGAWSRFRFAEGTSREAVAAVVTNHQRRARPADLRTLLRAAAQIDFDSIDFKSTMLLPAHRAECEKLRVACKQVQQALLRVLRARWDAEAASPPTASTQDASARTLTTK